MNNFKAHYSKMYANKNGLNQVRYLIKTTK